MRQQNQTKHDKSPKKREKLNRPPPPKKKPPKISNIHVLRTPDVVFFGKEWVDPMAKGADTCRPVKKRTVYT